MEIILKYKGRDFICQYDAVDHAVISGYKWNYLGGYAVATFDGRLIKMHRLILGLTDPDIYADHIDRDKLNNTRANLRRCTKGQNSFNRNANKDRRSQFKGVYKHGGRWHSQIMYQGNKIYLGFYRNEMTAGRIYDKAARELFEEFANTNNLPEIPEPEQLELKIRRGRFRA